MISVREEKYKKVQVSNDAFNRTVEVGRVIGCVEGEKPGPVQIFLGGVHGNEPAGLYALYDVFNELKQKKVPVNGSIYAFAGNLKALAEGERFLEEDLNRIWKKEDVDVIRKEKTSRPERQEQLDLWTRIEDLLNTKKGPFFFIDLHTTSSQSNPFLVFNDSITNRSFAKNFPLPVILGIEEHLEGPMLSYINEIGHVAMGIEAGQHEAPNSVELMRAFIKLSLVASGNIDMEDLPDYEEAYQTLSRTSPDQNKVFEIKYRYGIQEGEQFKMNPGFKNFQPIHKDEVLAGNKDGEITSHIKGRIFMPLYQAQGEDGYFLVKQVSGFWLSLSKLLRRFRFEAMLRILPGVKRHPQQSETLVVNQKVARLLATDLFHLLGFRRKKKVGNTLWFTRRKYDLRPPENPTHLN